MRADASGTQVLPSSCPSLGPELMYKVSSWPCKLVFCSLSSWLRLNNLINRPAPHLFTFRLTPGSLPPALAPFVSSAGCSLAQTPPRHQWMLLAQQPQRISSSFALCRDAHLRKRWPHSLFKEMFIFFSFKIKNKIYSLRKKLENSERLSKEKLTYALSQHQVKTTVSDWVSLDLKCVYGMFSFCGFIWNVSKSVQWRETSSRSESLIYFLFFYCLEAIYTKKEDFYMLFIAQYVKQLFKY